MTTNEQIKHSLSSMMDDEAEDLEIRQILASSDNELKQTWSRYQIARSVIRKEVFFPKIDIASAVSNTIAEEEKVLGEAKKAATQKIKSSFWINSGRLIVAASIMIVMLSVVYFFNIGNNLPTVDDYTKIEAVNDVSNKEWEEQRLSDLIERHEQHGMLGGVYQDTIEL